MPIENGTRLGPYEITAPLGAGGMGEVYRARDTKLNREVALKVLPAVFASNPERMGRFQREAQLLASLNHPNIAHIYGLEDSGGHRAIVMELVEGTTLKGRLPVADVLRLAKQVADAIEYAHDKGVIHRDLKPGNIMVTAEGSVKILDFGLAKALDDAGDSSMGLQGSMSPTLTLGATHAGVILGTAAYMAPEQAKGKKADRRADVWAFGVVLYEMLTGERMFGGETVAETLASVMMLQIALTSLPQDTPGAIRRLISRCLDRDLRRRVQSIGEARIVIEDVIAGVSEETPAITGGAGGRVESDGSGGSRARWTPWAVAALAVLAAIGTMVWTRAQPAPKAPGVVRFTVPPPEGTHITTNRGGASNLAVSPDGHYVAFIADETGRERTIWVRALDSLIAQRLDRTEGANYPFWSPDSQNIAYFAGGKLMRISVAGGAPLTVSSAPDGEGGTWFQAAGQDGMIVFAPGQNGPLQRVLAQGGVPTPVTKLQEGESGHIFPQFLPDGQRFLYLARGEKQRVYAQSIGSEQRTLVGESTTRVAFSPPGFLLYMRDATVLAQRWNLDNLKLEGEPVSVAEDVRSGGTNGRNAFAVSANGVLTYRAGGSAGNYQVTSYTREGKAEGIVLDSSEYGEIDLSPDDKHLVVIRGNGNDRDLWLKDLASGVFSRLTIAAGAESDPIWSPDSRRVAYLGNEGGKRRFFETLLGSGKQFPLPDDGKQALLEAWTPDGKQLLMRAGGVLSVLPAPQEPGSKPGETKAQKVFEETYGVDQFRISPDGKWVAYMSLESGKAEIEVATFPAFTNRRQISTGSATQPLWRADGKELFFLAGDRKLMAVDVKMGATLETGPVRTLFQTNVTPNTQIHLYAVARDGKRFFMREAVGSNTGAVEQLYVVTNWPSLVGR